MHKLTRRSMLRQSSALAATAAALLPANSEGQRKASEPDKKLSVVSVGGHFDDPQTCAGGPCQAI